jgi:transcriptional regulator with GAF, ATPase, and Fis domain
MDDWTRSEMSRERLLAATFVDLADTLVDDFDVVELLTGLAGRCVEVFDVDAAGVMLAAPTGTLRVIASSSPAMRVLEVFEIQAEEGPCPDSYRAGTPVVAVDLAASTDRWPSFAPEAVAAGFHSAVALPLRLRGSTIGALNLFREAGGELHVEDLSAAQAFADMATIGLLNRRVADDAAIVNRQLGEALESRVLIEQAKGMVAERTGSSIDEAFDRLRGHARSHNRRLTDVAADIVDGVLAPLRLDRPRRT